MWPDVEVEEMLPPAYNRRPRRPKKRQRRDPHPDPSKRRTKTTYTCTTCGGEKHNALSCKSLEVNLEAQKRKRKPKKNAIVEPAQDPNTSAAPPEVPNVDDDVEFEMLAADLAAAFEPTQTQPTVNAVTND
ncbi:hypothetical protein L195_g060142, partial [Trifolium pratense]